MRFLKATNGNMTVLFGLMLPVLAGGAALAVDIGRLVDERMQLQSVADSAALAAAHELYLANATEQQVEAVAETFARTNAADKTGTLAVNADVVQARQASSSGVGDAIEVALSKTVETTIARYLMADRFEISAFSRARVTGGSRICVVGLANDNNATIQLADEAKLTAPTCSVYSNSTKAKGLQSINRALLYTEMTCSAGGAYGGVSNYRPAALTDCPQIDDPLASRPAPKVGHCDYNDLMIKGHTRTLSPGVYCGGLRITGDASVAAKPGIYIIKDGNLVVDKTASLVGENVGFYFAGAESKFAFSKEATIKLTAPKSGVMAGLLFFQDRASDSNITFRITSNNARVLLGTIYLPNGVLVVDADMSVADKSAYTAIVSKRLELLSSPNLVLNTDYGLTDIPVPDGVGQVSDGVFLEE